MKCAEMVEPYRKRGYHQWAKGPPNKEAKFLPVFILIPGFKVQGDFEEFIKRGLERSKKVPVATLSKSQK